MGPLFGFKRLEYSLELFDFRLFSSAARQVQVIA
jgi:hypothetical protein